MSNADPLAIELAAVATALCRVASLGRALRRGPVGTDYIGHAIEGTASGALQALQSWTGAVSSGPARAISARIRSCLGHGDRATLGVAYSRGLVESGRRTVEQH